MTLFLPKKYTLAAILLSLLSGRAPTYAQSRPYAVPKVVKTAAMDAPSASTARTVMALQSIGANQTLHILVGQSTMLRGVSPMRRIYIGNPAILQTFTSGPEEVVVTAKGPGISSLVIWDTQGRSCLYTVSADIDPSALRMSLREAYPNSHIEVQATEDRINLTGTVPTPEAFDGIAKLAGIYSKDVANSLRIVPIRGKQVQLKLRILEVDRTKLEQFGVNIYKGAGNNLFGTSTQQFNVTQTTNQVPSPGISTVSVSDPLNLFFYNFSSNIGVTVKDLEQKDIVQILSEPTLTTMSGMPARFLSGGEFPFPVVQGGAGNGIAVSIQFRQYGVKVDFTPTVNADGSIRLKVAPEVSTLDYANAVTISGFTVPALSTRRAETEVELKDGQSFMLSGLLDHRTTENLSKVPGIANVPILGQFFRSKNNNHSITDLVVLATVTVVDPLSEPTKIVEPAMAVPNMESPTFDQQLKSTKRTTTPKNQ